MGAVEEFYAKFFTLTMFLMILVTLFTCNSMWNSVSKQDSESFIDFARMQRSNSKPTVRTKYLSKRIRDNFAHDRRIFFFKSYQENFDSIQCCSIESAAKHNPNRPVHLFHWTEDEKNISHPLDHCLEILKNFKNVRTFKLNMNEFFRAGPLESWYVTAQGNNRHLSAFFRLMEAYRHGGLYLDTNCITLRSYSNKVHLNFFPLADPDGASLTSSVFHAERSNPLILSLMQELAKNYLPYANSNYYTTTFVSSFVSNCIHKAENYSIECEKINFLPYDHFFPIPASMSKAYNEKSTNNKMSLINGSYAACVGDENGVIKKHSLLSLLASLHCQSTHSHYASL